MKPDGGILVVDDEFLIADLLSAMLEEMGLDVCGSAASAEEAVAAVRRHEPGLVLMDVRLRGARDGVDAAAEINAISSVPIIFITGSRERETVERIEAIRRGSVLFKPVRFDQLQREVLRAIAA
ncbi:MAG TPA: response regulator [Rhodopila sp.]|uniref:response regulator n=1 Tax=Rhodopila sp. TaxID=2480087 RepID=UPI002D135DE0|nr:response regulator [Rhodopila sp.]HVY14142.1 response regulator [Rhodopila sp.]